MEADIVANDLGPDNVQKKHVANIKWTPGKATVGIGMGKGMYDWIKAVVRQGLHAPRTARSPRPTSTTRRSRSSTFTDALITGVTVPEARRLEQGRGVLRRRVRAPSRCAGPRAAARTSAARSAPKQKAWLCSNFRVEIGDLPCNRVATVDSFTWKCAVVAGPVGIIREPTKHPAKVTVPDLKL